MLRLKFLLPLAVALAVAALWWWSQRDDVIVVGIDAPLVPDIVFDPSELNTSDLFFEENPGTLIRPRILYYGIKPGDGQTVFENAMAEGVEFFVTTQPSSVFVGNAPKFRDGRALVINTSSISPVTSGQDDYVLRIIPDAPAEQRALAAYLNKMPGGRLLVVQDSNNVAYTDPAYDVFAAEMARSGRWNVTHHKTDIAAFRPDEERPLMSGPFDALYVLAGDFHTSIGNITQLFHSLHPEAPILLTPWARSPMILEVAGAAIGNITLASHFPARAESPALDNYFRRFEARFGYKPQAMAIMVRQALELLDRAFAQGHRTPASVRDYLLSTPVHETSFGPVSFDAYGDTTKEFHFLNDVGRELQ
ncbi:MAG: ABC transporter substrate-binding protein [Chthoniobacterales bacterium]|nr:ABC transporter substrate-binding protein [Chthoniobacterales bacterium]